MTTITNVDYVTIVADNLKVNNYVIPRTPYPLKDFLIQKSVNLKVVSVRPAAFNALESLRGNINNTPVVTTKGAESTVVEIRCASKSLTGYDDMRLVVMDRKANQIYYNRKVKHNQLVKLYDIPVYKRLVALLIDDDDMAYKVDMLEHIRPSETPQPVYDLPPTDWKMDTVKGTADVVDLTKSMGMTHGVLNGTAYMLGGYHESTVAFNQFMVKSTDLLNWELVTSMIKFGRRYAGAMVTFKGKMYHLGGQNGATYFNDVNLWDESDEEWSQVSSTAPWEPRSYLAVCVFNDRVWVSGGKNSNDYYGDMYSTVDFVTWTKHTLNDIYEAGSAFTLTTIGDYVVRVGGIRSVNNGNGDRSKLTTYSDDMVNWKPIPGDMLPIGHHEIFDMGDYAMVVGGASENFKPYKSAWKVTKNRCELITDTLPMFSYLTHGIKLADRLGVVSGRVVAAEAGVSIGNVMYMDL